MISVIPDSFAVLEAVLHHHLSAQLSIWELDQLNLVFKIELHWASWRHTTLTKEGPSKFLKWQFVFSFLSAWLHRSSQLQAKSLANCRGLYFKDLCMDTKWDLSLPWIFQASPRPSYMCSHLVLMVVHSSPLTGSICHWNRYLATSPVPVRIPPWATAHSALWSAISCAPKAWTWKC